MPLGLLWFAFAGLGFAVWFCRLLTLVGLGLSCLFGFDGTVISVFWCGFVILWLFVFMGLGLVVLTCLDSFDWFVIALFSWVCPVGGCEFSIVFGFLCFAIFLPF